MRVYECLRCGTLRVDDDGCRVCGYGHLRELEFSVEEESTGEVEYECSDDDCDRSFDTPQGLAAHERVHE